MTTFLLISHAETDLVGNAIAGWMSGIHLNSAGEAQAQRLATQLAALPLQAVYCSPLEAARETAAPIAQLQGLHVQSTKALGEIEYGDWTGHGVKELEGDPRWRRFKLFGSGTRIPGGEMMIEVQTRVILLLEQLAELYPEETVVLVSHSEVIKTGVAHYAGIHLDLISRLEISPASISTVVIGKEGPHILQVNHTGELITS